MLSAETKVSSLDRSASKNSTAATEVDDESKDGAEICLSPSWSEFGATKKKKEKKQQEKAKKEMEKKQKRDWERKKADEIKAGKRLSKKPPAAMDTQKSSSGLRRNSAVSFTSSRPSSQGDPRRTSRGESAPSETSNGSGGKHRSLARPATSSDLSRESRRKTEYVGGSTAPQLPKLDSIGWHTRQSSAGTGNTDLSAGDRAYEKNLVDFAYRLEASTTPINSWKPSTQPLKAPQGELQPSTPSFNRSQTMPELSGPITKQLVGTELEQQAGSEDASLERETHPNGYGSPRVVYRRPLSATQASGGAMDPESIGNAMSEGLVSIHQAHVHSDNQRGPLSQSILPKDGSSYVHKQRMHQQQLSIASFQDEQAVKDANEKNIHEPLAEEESAEKEGLSLGTSITVSSESSTTRQTSLECECKEENSAEREKQPEQNQTPPKESTDVAKSTEAPVSPGSKTDRILSFRPFHRKGKHTSMQTKPVGSTPTLKNTLASSPKQPRLRIGFPLQKPPKSEKASEVRKSVQAETAHPAPVENHTVQPPEIERPLVQTHSRTRTSSSQILTDDMLVHKHLRRPSTAPSLPVIAPQPSFAQPTTKQEDAPDNLRPLGDTSQVGVGSDGQGDSHPEVASPPQSPPAVVVEGFTGEGLIHKTSMKRPRSNPMLASFPKPSSQLPSLDFLPELKHQPLIKPKRTSPIIPHFPRSPEKLPFLPKPPPLITSSPLAQGESHSSSPTKSKDLNVMPRSPLRLESHHPQEGSLLRPGFNSRRRTLGPTVSSNRSATMGPLSFGKGGAAEGLEAKPVAKLFVICCKCKFWHDLPSKLYELMAMPQKLSHADSPEGAGALEKSKQATLDTMVKCPWCEHYMTTWCCAGWTTVVYLHERHH